MSSSSSPRLKSSITPLVKDVLLRSGVLTALRHMAPSRDLAILRYHAVADPASCWYASPDICLSAADFEVHVRYLSRHYRVLSLPDAISLLQTRRTLPRNAVAITFDDGYADNLEAARILRRHGLTATFYITAGCMGGETPFWPSEVRYLLARISNDEARLFSDGRSVQLTLGQNGAMGAAREVNALMKSVTIPERERLRDELRRLADVPPMPSPMLTWDQVREMSALGMTIGCHTLTHANLPSAGMIDATMEIRTSRDRLRDETGSAVTMFSYPNGGASRYFTEDLKQVVRASGFAAATTSRNGFATTASDLFALQRVRTSSLLRDVGFALEVERFWRKPADRHGDA